MDTYGAAVIAVVAMSACVRARVRMVVVVVCVCVCVCVCGLRVCVRARARAEDGVGWGGGVGGDLLSTSRKLSQPSSHSPSEMHPCGHEAAGSVGLPPRFQHTHTHVPS